MKILYKNLFLVAVFFSGSYSGYAQITGGTISFSQSALDNNQPGCYNSSISMYNYAAPTGGSGQYIYSWEKNTGSGWVTEPYYTSASQLSNGQSCCGAYIELGKTSYYRRKAKNSQNLLDSAYSNIIEARSFHYDHGYVGFSQTGPYISVPVGSTPPTIINITSGSVENPPMYYFWEKKKGVNGTYYDIPGATSAQYQPATENTADTFYYRRFVYDGSCGGYPGGTSEIVITFFTPFNPGTISVQNANPCPGQSFVIRSTATTAPSPYSFQWQSSTDSVTWTNIANATGDSLTVAGLTQSRFYRRNVISGSNTVSSNFIRISINQTQPGNTSIFGDNKWINYAYAGTSLSLNNISYSGNYTSDSLNINTNNDWPASGSPSDAAGYIGCPVNGNQFTLVAKRMGFDTGTYEIQVPVHNGEVRVYVNGILTFSRLCCNTNVGNIHIGKLGSAAKVEIRYGSTSALSPLQVNFIKVGPRPASYIDTAVREYKVFEAKGNEFVYLLDSLGSVVAAVNPNGNNLGTLSVSMKHSAPGSANIPADTNGVKLMPRYFNFTSSTYPEADFPTPVTVRLFYLNVELNDYRAATNQPALDSTGLRVSHYDGTNEDCDINNNTAAGDVLTPVLADAYGSDGFFVDVMAPSFSEFGVTGGTNLLPVNWISATATKRKSLVEVQWKVAKEFNNARFEIWRSKDAASFTKTGTVESKGNTSNPVAYTYNDNLTETTNNLLYYRIKQVDKDNRYTWSPVMKVKVMESIALEIIPNPVTNFTTIRSEGVISHITITDQSGRIIYKTNSSSNNVTLNASGFAKGIYVIKARLLSGEEKTMKLVKQ